MDFCKMSEMVAIAISWKYKNFLILISYNKWASVIVILPNKSFTWSNAHIHLALCKYSFAFFST